MEKVLQYVSEEGQESIVTPTPEWEGELEELAAIVVPEGCDWKIIDKPKTQERTFDEIWQNARLKRNILLQETDYLLLADYPINKAQLEKVKQYRKTLRDLPQENDKPDEIVWPEKPE